LLTWLLRLVSGAVGGNVGGALIKDQRLGPIVNTVLGLIGGVGGSSPLLAGYSRRGKAEMWGRLQLLERCCRSSLGF
jgi:uncharacterized membrane protein YeaQ/YmgE (transglycosylase-associated protein family)